MSKIVKVSQGDYRLQVQSGGFITLDTGAAVGTVVITGNLDVKGITTTIESTNTTITDNVIILNQGQQGSGISSALNYQAGIQISRGTSQSSYPDAQLIFDESVQHYDAVTSTNQSGAFIFRNYNTSTQLATGLTGIQVGSISTASANDLVFDMQNSIRKLRIVNSANYASRVIADNDIPNRKFITDYVSAGGSSPGQADVDRLYKSVANVEKARVQAYDAYVQFSINTIVRAQVTSAGLDVDNINLFNNTITNKSLNNLVLAATNSNIEVNGILNLDDQLSVPTYNGGQTKLVSRSSQTTLAQTPGRTGIFFSNTIGSDELVAKNRALLFSMLF